MRPDQRRRTAKMRGERTYRPENSCGRGHYERYTANGKCVACTRAAENAAVAANRDQYNARKRSERARLLPKLAGKARASRSAEAPEKRAARLSYARDAQAVWRAMNPGRPSIAEAKRRYKASDRGAAVSAEAVARRRAGKALRTPAWLTTDDLWMMREAYALARLRTTVFGFPWHVDHVFPLRGTLVSGLHVPLNLQVIPWVDNIRKSNKLA